LEAVLRIAAQSLSVALSAALVTVPLCILLARRFGVVDKPGGRKQHGVVTPLLGGVGIVAAVAVGLVLVQVQSTRPGGLNLKLEEIAHVIVAAGVIFLIGLIDDVFKDRMSFQLKLLGQVAGVLVLMGDHLWKLLQQGGLLPEWLYMLFFLGWYLTIVNSFNFSDNMNGLMAGLSVIAFGASLVYLGTQDSLRSLMIAVLLVGGLLGFLPYNFPRSRVFLGDAGSMFVGFWMAWIQIDMASGFMGTSSGDFGASHLIPAVLIMGVPLYDAAFVVVMRVVDRRPIYLGDNHHLSHRLVRSGFTPVEAVVTLWGLGIVLAGVGILSAFAKPQFRYLLLALSVLFMIAVTRLIMSYERRPPRHAIDPPVSQA
jgi:UDP-GlcNAc:undecaprenyl-phosphate/decaprenyl-phosphate GlcNAc-1-phosphate transferase